MTVKELINKLIDLQSPNEEIGISIRKKISETEEIIYVGARGELKITVQEQIGDPRGCWLEGEIKESPEELHHYAQASAKSN